METLEELQVVSSDIKLLDEYFLDESLRQVHNCNGQYFHQKCVNCSYELRIWCTSWQACPRCGTKNYGKHHGAK